MNYRTKSKEGPVMSRRITVSVAVLLLALAMGCRTGHVEVEGAAAQLTEGFPEASVTIFPLTVFWVGLESVDDEGARAWAAAYESGFRENARSLADTLGLLLEEKGYDKYQIADAMFEPPDGNPTRQERTAAFAKFVAEQHLKTDYALGTEITIFAEPFKSGFYVYSVIVDADGSLAWADDREYPGKMEFECLEVARDRMTPVMALDTLPKKELTPDKKQVLWELRAKQPPSGSERKAMDERLKAMKEAGASARVLVYPARVGGDHAEPDCAAHVGELLNEARLCRASAAKTAPLMEGSGWPNEMHVLWLFARSVREYLRQHPPDSDYVLFADYWFNPRGQVWAVHFVVCDQAGDWVIADLQNNHHDDFQRIDPKTLEDCNRLVLERLEAELR